MAAPTWQPSEIIIHEAVRNDPITQHILSTWTGKPPAYIKDSKPATIKAASTLLSEAPSELLPLIAIGKQVLYLSPAGTDFIDKFEIEDKRLMCPEFSRLKLASNGCYYNCDWCFLKATYRANQNFITVRVQYDKIKESITNKLKGASGPQLFNTGELADSLSMEHLTKAAREFIPFFGETDNGYLYMLSKSDNVDDILKLKHNGHTILTWSLNADFVSKKFEVGAPDFVSRLKAAKKAQEAGYRIRVRLDPIVPIVKWEHFYAGTIKRIFEEIQPERITLGTLRFEENFVRMKDSILHDKILKDMMGSMKPMLEQVKLVDGKKSIGKYSFPLAMRLDMFSTAIQEIRKYSDCDIALCKETKDTWEAVGLDLKGCKCVCQYDSADMTIIKPEVIKVTKAKKTETTTEVQSSEPPPATASVKYEPRELYKLDITTIKPDPTQPRKSIDETELNELTASIKKHGVLQPILFRKDSKGYLIIVSGERRYQASLLAEEKTIPAIFTEGNAAELALVENLLRVDLTAIEEAEALDRLKKEERYTNKELAAIIGKAESTIAEILKLNLLPEKLRNKHRTNKQLSRRSLLEVAKAPDEKEMKKLFKKVLDKETKRDEIREERNASTRGADVVCRTMSNGLIKVLTSMDLATVDEDKRDDVMKALNDTLVLLAEKLGVQLVRP